MIYAVVLSHNNKGDYNLVWNKHFQLQTVKTGITSQYFQNAPYLLQFKERISILPGQVFIVYLVPCVLLVMFDMQCFRHFEYHFNSLMPSDAYMRQ